jgi:D-glycero-D-manno-heptose 1,7-bisphosphate phosphatase
MPDLGRQRYLQDKQRRFVVLDRDGTINVERPYLSDPRAIELLPRAAQGLHQLMELGLGLAVITNQSGLGRGFFNRVQLDCVHKRLYQLLEAQGVYLDGLYVCPHRPEEQCPCRKPRTGLLELAAMELEFDPKACFVIGDKACDIALGKQVGATTFLVRTGHGAGVLTIGPIVPDYVVDDMQSAAQIISRLVSVDAGHGADDDL